MRLLPIAIIGLLVSAPASAFADQPKAPREFTVYFDYEQAGLSQGLVLVRAAVDYGGPHARYEVVGHFVEDERADIADQRTNSLGIALRTMGVDRDKVSTASDPYPSRRIHNAERRVTISVLP